MTYLELDYLNLKALCHNISGDCYTKFKFQYTKKRGLLFTDIVNESRTYYIIVARSRIVAELDCLRREAQELVLEGLQPGGR